MQPRNLLKETNLTPSDHINMFARKPPVSAGLPNSNASPRNEVFSASKQDPKILCKRIDNTAHNVNIKNDQPSNQKFVPLAFPLENLKKKSGQPSLTRAEGIGQPDKKYTQSTPQSVIHSQPETRPQSMPVSQNTSLTFNPDDFYRNDPKGFRAQKVSRQYEQEVYRASMEQGRGLMEKLLLSPGKEQKKPGLPKKKANALKKPSVSDKSPRKQVLQSIKERRELGKLNSAAINQRSMKDLRDDDSAKARSRQFENNRMIKSGKNSKAASPVRVEQPAPVQKKTMRKVTKREHVSKSEVPPAMEELIQRNANEYLEGLKAKKHVSELEKKLKDERKKVIEEGNKMIRAANMQRFNVVGIPPRPQIKSAWGAGQPKQPTYDRPETAHQRAKSKLEDQDRRKVLGLEHLDEERIRQLQKKALIEQRQREKSVEQMKPKKQLDSEEKMRLKEYMNIKKAKIEQEQFYKDIQVVEDQERKKRNLEKLYGVIQESREREVKKTKPITKKKLKKRKERSSPRGATRRKNIEDIVAERNSSAYYREYMNIIGSRQNAEEAYKAQLKQQEELRGLKKKGGYIVENRDEYHSKGKKSSGRGKDMYDYERREAQEVMMKMDTHSFSDDDDIKSNRMMIGDRKSDSAGESKGNVPEDSVREILEAREIIEAAVIFIQKNYRGYRTRKLLKMFFDQLYLDEMERIEQEREKYYQEQEEEQEEQEDEEEKESEGEEEEEEEEEVHHYEEQRKVVPMLENKKQQQIQHDKKSFEKERVQIENFDDEDEDNEEFGKEDEEDEDIEQEELDEEEQYYSQQRLREQYNREVYGKSGADKMMATNEDTERLKYMKQIDQHGYFESSHPSRYSDQTSSVRVVEDYLRDQKPPKKNEVQQQKRAPEPEPEDEQEEEEEEEEEEGFGQIQILRRAKSDGELLADRQFGIDDDMEDSNQISFHDDDVGDSYGQMRGHGHGGYNQGYLKGVTMKGGMLAMDNSEHTDRMEDEEIDEGHPFQSEGQSSGREYEDQARYQGYLQQKGLQIPAQFSQLNKVSTVNSVSVPTKNLIESQFNPDTKLIRSGDYINAQSEEYIPSEPGLHSHLDASIPFEIPFEEESKTELKVPKDISGIGEFEGGEEEKMMRLSNPLETNESPVQESPVKSEELLKRHTVQSITIEKQEVEEKSLKGRRIEQEEEENKKDEAIQTVERSPITYGHSEEGLSLPTGARSSITQHEKMLLQKTFELSTHYQNELVRLREEQAKQWSEVISQLEVLQTQGDVNLNQKVKHFVENLSKQSEINKKQLMENMELQNLVKTQSGLSERSLMTEVEILLKQRPEESKNATERSLASFKKVESPAHSEGKFQKKRKPMEFAKKPNLEIDVNTANDDQGEGNGGMNLDLSQMRLALGSEQLVRQQSARTLSQSLGTPTDLEMIDLNTPENIDGAVSIFERDPFKEFTHKKLGELMSKDSMQKIFKMREDALEMRHKSQMDSMKKMLEAHKFSPRTFQNKAIELEKWVTKERENIQRNKKNMERGWLSTADSIKRTQRDIQFIQKSSGPQGEGRHSTMSDLSLRQSFADEEHLKTDHGETSIDKYSVRSSVQRQTMGTEVISPTASKNIKIVDKFELHDTPDVKKVDEKRKDSIHSDILQKEISSRQFTEEKETEKSEREARSPDYPRFSPEKKEGRDTTPLSFKNNSQVAYSGGAGSLRHLDHEPMTEGDFEAGLTEKEIDWQSEARVSVPVIPSKSEYKATRTEESAPPTKYRRTQVHLTEGSENRSGSSSSHTPKGNNDIRSMIQEHLDNGKLVDIVNKDQDASYKEEKSMESKRKDLSGRKETLTEEDQPPRETGHDLNIQKKTDIITEEVFKALIEEFGQEFMDTAGREQVVEKVKELEKGGVEAVLQNLIENKYFFTAGAEKHPGFQANIAMPPAELVHEIEKLHHQADIYAQKDEIDEDITQEEVSKHELEKEVHTTEEQEQEAAVKKEEDESEVLPDGVDEDQVQHTESQAGEAGDLYRVLGIKTDMKAVEAYLDILISEIKGDYLTEFLRNINVPIGLSVTEKLNNMHAYDPAGSESSLEMSAGLQQAILSIQLYLEIETKIMEENPLKNEVSVELEHIHNKMIFDCLNEVLDSHRPYGLVGEPYPWKSTIRSNQPTPITRHNIERVLQTAKKKVLAWATYICGYYGEKDDFIQDRTQSFVEEYLAQVKEEKLSKMLAAEIHEVEDKWLAYDDEEAEVQLEISDLIFDKLVTEAAELIVQINNSRRGVKPKQPELPKLEEKKLKRKGSL